jgi:hypothetical protein
MEMHVNDRCLARLPAGWTRHVSADRTRIDAE